MKKSIGKNTLGGGNKMNVDLKTYNRSTHNLSYAWRSTMGVGTLVPFMKQVALPGDTFDIELDLKVFTHPTIGPLFGSYKIQMDIFTCPMRLYMAPLHNNALNIGLDMAKIKIPKLKPEKSTTNNLPSNINEDEWRQINPSSIMAYLGVKGWANYGNIQPTKNALPLLSYLDIFKNYYANKQEEKFYALMSNPKSIEGVTTDLTWNGNYTELGGTITIPKANITQNETVYIYFKTKTGRIEKYAGSSGFFIREDTGANVVFTTNSVIYGKYEDVKQGSELNMKEYDLEELDDLREYILAQGNKEVIFEIDPSTGSNNQPSQYVKDIIGKIDGKDQYQTAQPLSGLIVKTYQSDIFNNWVKTEWIDGENGINSITAIDTSSGKFSIDQFNLAEKVYDMLNRIAVSGGTYYDWINTVYTSNFKLHAETPVYEGGASSEIVFEEIVSNSASEDEPLGTLAGRGVAEGLKGGKLHIKVEEPSYLIGIVSITPRVDYCQGNDWDVYLETMDDLHKPALDGIGFQDLLTNRMAWWTISNLSVGKQPAWIEYMTNYNKVFGNFAINGNERFMCLVKTYEMIWDSNNYIDPTKLNVSSYIEPEMYSYIFADNDISAQNFWVQIGVGMNVRRVMSAKQIPNL